MFAITVHVGSPVNLYTFGTQLELQAFFLGIAEMSGWADSETIVTVQSEDIKKSLTEMIPLDDDGLPRFELRINVDPDLEA